MWTRWPSNDGNSDSKTHAVGQKQENDFSLYDMSGNVWEWLADCWHANYQGAPEDGSAWESGCTYNIRLLRGGSWNNKVRYVRSAFLYWNLPDNRNDYQGFRLAQD